MTVPLRRRRRPSPASPAHPRPEPNPFAPVAAEELVSAPGPWHMLLEARAPWEYAAMLAAAPFLARLPAGDGHPVLVFPGLGAADFSTLAMRNFLRDRGYTPYPWQQGFNFGPRHGVLEACRERLRHIHDRHGERVSLIGWSLGGIYARELAKEQPGHARCVITLGSPFAGHPRSTNAWRFYEMVSGQAVHDHELAAQVKRPPACPTTSIYSKTDGVVSWQCSLNDPAPHTENIEVHASHIGMGMNPLAMYAIADRLAQDPQAWRPFDLKGARRWFYKVTHGAPLLAGFVL
ncbi:esterase/lipase family protein [Rubrivivax sp. A210]|uniref:esterase/lipase family protein n=1 Tax=Rubrivivax sp. A210 TaxID=2772301 RepID=UPI0019180C1A|nr:alpha/beta hydrolase [Rubrivivax sp. A210]